MIWKFLRTKLWYCGDQHPILSKPKEGCDPLTPGSVEQDPQIQQMADMAGKPALTSLNSNDNNTDDYNYNKHLLNTYYVPGTIKKLYMH